MWKPAWRNILASRRISLGSGISGITSLLEAMGNGGRGCGGPSETGDECGAAADFYNNQLQYIEIDGMGSQFQASRSEARQVNRIGRICRSEKVTGWEGFPAALSGKGAAF